MYICIFAQYMCKCMRVFVYIRIYVYMCVGIYVYMCVGIYVYVCIYMCVHTYTKYVCISVDRCEWFWEKAL